MDVPAFASRHLGIRGEHLCFEIDKAAIRFLQSNHPDSHCCGSVTERNASAFSPCDIVIAGFPCQPFSALGRQEGWADAKGRGVLILATLDYIKAHRPRIVLLENVIAFTRIANGTLLSWLVDLLEHELGYVVAHTTLCTSRYGLPQTRGRWYLVGLRRDAVATEFSWPSEVEAIPLRAILDPRSKEASCDRRPGAPGSIATRNVDKEIALLTDEGLAPRTRTSSSIATRR